MASYRASPVLSTLDPRFGAGFPPLGLCPPAVRRDAFTGQG